MVDKVKPLKIESPSLGGTELDVLPTEMSPVEDYVSAKGMAFEGLDAYRVEKLGRALVSVWPDGSQKSTFSGFNLTAVEFYNSATQITANRIAKVDITYTGYDPTTEAWKVYDSDGATVLRTLTLTHAWSSGNYVSTSEVTS